MPTCPVSVILPFYNCEHTIVRALRSAVEQTHRPAEILCIDDGSTDQSVARIEAYKASVPHSDFIKVIKMVQNQGVYVARNIGLEKASQEYVAFLDADDFWHPRKFEIQFEIFRQNPDIFFQCHGVGVWVPDDTSFKFPDISMQEKSVSEIKKHPVLWKTKMHTISILMKKSNKYWFDASKRRGGDNLMWLEVVLNNEKAIFNDQTLAWKAKDHFGAGGLSGHLIKAELANQHSFWVLARKNLISYPYCFLLQGWCWVKFVRRVMIVAARRLRYALRNQASFAEISSYPTVAGE